MEIVLDTASLVVDSRNIWIGFTMVLLLGACFLYWRRYCFQDT